MSPQRFLEKNPSAPVLYQNSLILPDSHFHINQTQVSPYSNARIVIFSVVTKMNLWTSSFEIIEQKNPKAHNKSKTNRQACQMGLPDPR
jgi:hypothetical protein